MSCHVYGTAIPIPFDNPEALKKELSGTLHGKIKTRVDAGTMPPTSSLSPDDRRAIKEYMDSLRGK